VADAVRTIPAGWLWVPAFAGTTPSVPHARFKFQTATNLPRRHAPEDLQFRFALEKQVL
jgi:hypothetical protein